MNEHCVLVVVQIHIMSLDFALLSTFSAFWVYNDMTARKWYFFFYCTRTEKTRIEMSTSTVLLVLAIFHSVVWQEF